MLGTYFTFPELLLWVPFVTGLIAFMLRDEKQVRNFALVSTLMTLGISVVSLFYTDVQSNPDYFYYNNVSYVWLPYIGSGFSVGLDGMGVVLTFLTALTYPMILAVSRYRSYKNARAFFGLLLLSQAGIMGVFVANDALLFYFFWELALIPIYFLCSKWGEERRIQATFKFFIYTFTGSLLMLVGIMYVYYHTPALTATAAHSFNIRAFYANGLDAGQQAFAFWLFFAAFAVKIPIFPLHTWQPGVYEQSNYPSVMILSALMVKMGVFGMIRWILPVFPDGSQEFSTFVMILSVIGVIYASAVALVQNDLKRFVAWTSIAHLGLMGAAIFARNESSLQGVILEMFNHGMNILALWIVVDVIEKKTGVRKIKELSGLAVTSPVLAIFLVIIAFANIALPLTNSFVSEFLMFNGLFQYNKIITVFAVSGIVLSSAYMLRMVQFVFFGKPNELTQQSGPIGRAQAIVLSLIILFVIGLGVYPSVVLNLTKGTVESILSAVTF